MIDDTTKWKHLILDVIFADDEKTIKDVYADSKRVLSNITEADLSAYLKQLGDQGWEFVHLHTKDQLYHVYYFKRPKVQTDTTQGSEPFL